MKNDEDILQLIEQARIARMAQLDFDKQVHAIPFVYVLHERTLFSPIDGKPKRHAKLSRLAWIQREPKVTVLIDEYGEDWTQLWWLRLYGEAKQINDSDASWEQVARKLKNKYPQYGSHDGGIDMFTGEPTMLSIDIQRWRYWSA